MRSLCSLVTIGAFLLLSYSGNSQVTTNGACGLAPSYPSLADAIAALNAAVITAPVIIDVQSDQVAPSGGYMITAEGSSMNAVVINGNHKTLTAAADHKAGNFNDAIIKLIGADWITIKRFTLQENPSATNGSDVTNTVTEWGIALLAASISNGSQHNTVQENIISLRVSATDRNTFGIYSSVAHAFNSISSGGNPIVFDGTNSFNKIYANTIFDVNFGISFIGSSSSGNFDSGNEIGGETTGLGNTITNFGKVPPGAVYASNTATNYGIQSVNQVDETIAGNTLISNDITSAGTAVGARGILKSSTSETIGTHTSNIKHNTITIFYSAAASDVTGILSTGSAEASGTTLHIEGNKIIKCKLTGGGSSIFFKGISNTAPVGTLHMTNNLVRGITSNQSGGIFSAYENSGAVVNAILINNNKIGNEESGAIQFTATVSGSCQIISNTNAGTVCTLSISGNEFYGISHASASGHDITFVENVAPSLITRNFDGNLFKQISLNTSSPVTFFRNASDLPANGVMTVIDNEVTGSFSKTGATGDVKIFDPGIGFTAGADASTTISNNTFSNLTFSGTSLFVGITFNLGSTCTISGNTFSSWALGGINTTGNSGISVSNGTNIIITGNSFTGITSPFAFSAITCSSSGVSALLELNTVSGITAGTNLTGISYTGSHFHATMSRNVLHNLMSSDGPITAINHLTGNGTTTSSLFRNKISGIQANSATGTVCGLKSGKSSANPGATSVYNNIIGDLKAPASALDNAVRALEISSTNDPGDYNLYYNTVYLNATSSAADFGASALSVTSGSTFIRLDLRNNILVTTSTPNGTGLNVVLRGIAVAEANYAATSGHNLLYAGTPGTQRLICYVSPMIADQTLSSFQSRVYPREERSVTLLPTFISTDGSSVDFLHIDTGIPTPVESGGTPVTGMTRDFDDVIRAGNTGYSGTGLLPDLGADEGEFAMLDILGPKIQFDPLSGTASLMNRVMDNVVITDFNGIKVSPGLKPRLYYKKKTQANTYNDNTSGTDGWKYVEANGSTSPFDFTIDYMLLSGGGVSVGDTIQYFVIAQDTVATPNVGLNSGILTLHPASVVLDASHFPLTNTIYAYAIKTGISGVKTVCSSGCDYPSLTNAGGVFEAINNSLVTDDLTIQIAGDLSGELGTHPLNAFPDTSTIMIIPSGGVRRIISGAVPAGSALIELNGADHVTIDGLNTGGDSLTIMNTSVSATAETSTIRFRNGASGNTVARCKVLGSSTVLLGSKGGNIYFNNTSASPNNNNTIQDCDLGPAGSNLPTCLVYASNTTACTGNAITQCRLFDFFSPSKASAAIYLENAPASVWTISDNKLFQKASRTFTTTSLQHSGIVMNGGSGHTISGNTIGYASAAGTGTYAVVGVSGSMLVPISLSVGNATATEVQGNRISKFSFTGPMSGTGASSPFTGIAVSGGLIHMGTTTGNIIGDTASTLNILYGVGSSSTSEINGVYITGATSNVTFRNNAIGGIEAALNSTGGTRVYALRLVNDATLECRFNKIGGSQAHSIRSLATANSSVYGIQFVSNTPATISDNLIRNLTSAMVTTSAPGVTGIELISSSAQFVSHNRILGLTTTSTSGSGVTTNTGIRISSSTQADMMSLIDGNQVHSILSSNALDPIIGIQLVEGNNTCTNNMIRLGKRLTGTASVTAACPILGISDEAGTARLFHNSVYIGGTGVANGMASTAAFSRTNPTAFEVRNNIFCNGRQNASSGGSHYIFSFAEGDISNHLDYNLYYNTGGNGNKFSIYSGTESASFQAWKNLAQSLNLVVDQHSDAEDPFFISPEGNADVGDLHIQMDRNSDVESKGDTSLGIIKDIDGQTRNSPPDIGADEDSFSSPVILYSPLEATTSTGNRTLSNVTINPPGGVNLTPGTKPRVYFKKKTDPNDSSGWKYTETTSSGSPYTFLIDYSLLNEGMAGENDTIQYFVIAQDTSAFPRVAMEDGFYTGFPTGVELSASEFPITGNIHYYVIRKTITGTKTICASGCDYTSLTNDGGFFQEVNNGVVTGNVDVQIQDNLLSETGAHPLNGFTPGYLMTIKPSGGLTRTISGAAPAGKPLIDFNGADSVLVDGLNTGGDSLYITNTTVSGTEGTSTIRFRKDARSCTIRNCIISGSSAAPGSGIVYITSEARVTGNDHIKLIRNTIGAAGGNPPVNAIYLTGPAEENNNIVIDSNLIHDFFLANGNSAGIFVSSNCPGIIISHNRFYQTSPRTKTNTTTTRDCAISSSSGCTVINNVIGGSDSSNAGVYAYTGASLSQLHPIYLAAPTTSSSTISGNVIKNISMTGAMNNGGGSNRPFVGIYHASGAAIIDGNTIGDMSVNGNISYTTTSSSPGTVIGIRSDALSNDLTTENNQLGGITMTEGSTGAIHFTGISAEMNSTNKWICHSNIIGGSMAGSIQTNGSATGRLLYGLYSSGAQSSLEENIIRNMNLTGASSGSLYGLFIQASGGHSIVGNEIYGLMSTNAVINGMYLTLAASPVTVIERNKVHSLVPLSETSAVTAIVINGGQVNVCNNMIRLGIDVDGLSISVAAPFTGIADVHTGNIGVYYFNSVYIGGSVAGTTANHSIGFNSLSNSKNFRNNIVYNARSNTSTGGKHYALSLSNDSGLVTDHNLYYVTGTNGVLASISGADKADLDALRITTSQDASSQFADPVFANPTGTAALVDLHINPSVVSPAEGNGLIIPEVTTDYDLELRSTNTPADIGADAGMLMGMDKIAPRITFTDLSADYIRTSRQVSEVMITDPAGGIETMTGLRPRLYFKKSTDPDTEAGWKYVEANGTATPFDFTIQYSLLNSGSISVGDEIQYFIVAADTAMVPNVGKNKAIFNTSPSSVVLTGAQFPITGTLKSYVVLDSITGTKTVCNSGCDFTSLTNNDTGGAFKAINERALAGNVTLLITSDLTSESGMVSLSEFAAPYTVTIKPDGAPRTVTYSGSNSLIVLNGADRVVIDGSLSNTPNTLCPLSQASRDLTFRNVNASESVISLRSSAANPAVNNIIRNCTIEGDATSATRFGIASADQTVTHLSLGKDNDQNAFINNHISQVRYGIYSQGENRTNKNEGTIISLNDIDLMSPNATAVAGIYLGYENGTQVTGNIIRNVSGSAGSVAGIALGILPSNNMAGFIGHDITGADISRNSVHDVTRQGDGSAFGITLSSLLTAGASANEISNNVVYKINSTGATTMDMVAGILAGGGSVGETSVFHNTVRLTGVSSLSAPGFAIAVGSVNPDVEVKNNILVNEMTSALGKNYAIGLAYAGDYSNLQSDHNDFYTPGSPLAVSGGLNNSPAGDLSDLAAFQALTGKDMNSKNVLPEFVSATDLHLTTSTLNLVNLDAKGTPVPVEIDFDCDERSTTHPDIGMDEIEGCTNPQIDAVTADVNPVPCSENSTNLMVSGSLNGAGEWTWYAGSCGGTVVGTGTTIEVMPDAATTYYVRGEGGCVTDQPCQSIMITIAGATITNTDDSGTGSLREAINCAGDGDTLVFDGSVLNPGDTIEISSGPLVIGKDIIMDQDPSELVRIKATGAHSIFEVGPGSSLALKNLKLFTSGANPNLTGRAIMNQGALILESVEIFEKQENLPGTGNTIHIMPGSTIQIFAGCALKVQ